MILPPIWYDGRQSYTGNDGLSVSLAIDDEGGGGGGGGVGVTSSYSDELANIIKGGTLCRPVSLVIRRGILFGSGCITLKLTL